MGWARLVLRLCALRLRGRAQVRAALAAETRVVTMDTPLAFMAGEGVRELSGAAAKL